MVMYIYLLTLGMITQKYSQKQKYTISKNKVVFFKKFFRGGQTHLDKKNLPNFQVHGLEPLKLSINYLLNIKWSV